MTQPLDIGIVSVVATRAKHKEIATARTLAHPLKSSIEVLSSTHQGEATLSFRLYVRGIPGTKIFVTRAVCKGRAQQ